MTFEEAIIYDQHKTIRAKITENPEIANAIVAGFSTALDIATNMLRPCEKTIHLLLYLGAVPNQSHIDNVKKGNSSSTIVAMLESKVTDTVLSHMTKTTRNNADSVKPNEGGL